MQTLHRCAVSAWRLAYILAGGESSHSRAVRDSRVSRRSSGSRNIRELDLRRCEVDLI